MPKALNIPPNDIQVIAGICQLPVDTLRRFQYALASADVLLRDERFEQIAADAGIPDAPEVSRILLILTSISRRHSVSEVIEDLDVTLEHKLAKDDFAGWSARREMVSELLSSRSLIGLSKAIDLQYDRSAIFTEAKVLTDVRPVFDDAASTPVGALLCHVLRVRYADESRGFRSIELALDARDLQDLAASCNRALAKAKALASYFAEPKPLPVTDVGESNATSSK